MKRILVALIVIAAVAGAALWYLTDPARQMANLGPMPTRQPDLENGRILFFAGGCTSCHAKPNDPDKLKLGGGYALKSSFGTFYVPNISPHKTDGIGSWTLEQFVAAMRLGVIPKIQAAGRSTNEPRHTTCCDNAYPAFPYTSYQRMSPEDLSDLFAFMQTLPAVEGRAPDHDLPFPFNIRRGVGLWKLAFLDGTLFTPDPSKSAALNRGAYLVNGPGHCTECHSERNAAGAIIEERRFAGGPDPEGRGAVPNITPHQTGIGGWTPEDLATLLKTGETPLFDTVGGPMGAVVANMAQLPEADRRAMAEYLLSLPPRQGFKRPE